MKCIILNPIDAGRLSIADVGDVVHVSLVMELEIIF